MKRLTQIVVFATMLGACAAASGQDAQLSFGGDQYAAGQAATIAAPVQHDAFVMGNDVSLTSPVSGDAHLAGFDVDVEAAVAGDVYAAGFSINVSASVGGDLTAAGNSVTVRSTAPIAGNARLAGAAVTLATPVSGSALVTAQALTLDAPIAGDFSFYGESLTFGPGARVDGRVEIRAPKDIPVPAAVAASDRVRFELLETPDYVAEAGKSAGTVVGRFWPVFWTVAAWWLLLFLAGTAMIALLPRVVAALQIASRTRPFRRLGLGFLAFATILGLVPAIALTVVGLLLLPFVLVFAAIACSLAYVAGAYFIGVRIASAFVPVETNVRRLGVLAAALVVAALVGMIPFIGWLAMLLIVIYGFGLIAAVTMARWSAPDAAALAAQPAQ